MNSFVFYTGCFVESSAIGEISDTTGKKLQTNMLPSTNIEGIIFLKIESNPIFNLGMDSTSKIEKISTS